MTVATFSLMTNNGDIEEFLDPYQDRVLLRDGESATLDISKLFARIADRMEAIDLDPGRSVGLLDLFSEEELIIAMTSGVGTMVTYEVMEQAGILLYRRNARVIAKLDPTDFDVNQLGAHASAESVALARDVIRYRLTHDTIGPGDVPAFDALGTDDGPISEVLVSVLAFFALAVSSVPRRPVAGA